MREFLGCVILESLDDPLAVAAWAPVAQKVSDMPDDPDAKVWHTCWYRLTEEQLLGRLDRLATAMRPQWYAHFWSGDDLCVVLAGRAFWMSASDRASWAPMQAYGATVGTEAKWLESIPTTVPVWVHALV